MYDDEEDFRPDENDKLFEELDKLTESSKEILKNQKIANLSNVKFKARLELINLMMEEVPLGDINIREEDDGHWVAEVKYHGINFICIVGKNKPQFWDEVFDPENRLDDK